VLIKRKKMNNTWSRWKREGRGQISRNSTKKKGAPAGGEGRTNKERGEEFVGEKKKKSSATAERKHEGEKARATGEGQHQQEKES